MNCESGIGILNDPMSNAAIRFQDILKRRTDPRKEKPDRPTELPENLERYRRVTAVLPESFWDMPMPDDPEASVRAALAEERDSQS
jgi:hypothetical protein